jgi:hypothetical protein
MRGRARKALVAVAAASLVVVPILTGAGASATVAGAGFTTFDKDKGGCVQGQHPNGIDCNNYASKGDVYMSGGPSAAGLSNGTYYFAVLVPGFQNDGFLEGAAGNLSDETQSADDKSDATVLGAGGGDPVACRTFSVTDNEISDNSSGCAHPEGTSPNSRRIIQLSPYDDTTNNGGVYILAICQTGATSPSQCKYDAFRVKADGTVTNFGVVSGGKYYDANENGQWDPTEDGIAGWPINFSDGVSGTLTTASDGTFSDTFVADDYTFAEVQAGSPWVQTGEVAPSQAQATGGASVTLNADKTYSVSLVDNSEVTGLYFGNVCRLTPGGLTMGFWSNKNGQKLFTNADLAALVALNLRNANGSAFDPASYAAYKTWLLSATATNMAYMLSAQMSATVLNIRHGITDGTVVVGSDGTVQDVVNAANALLANPIASGTFAGQNGGLTVATSALRTEQERLKNILDKTNNGGAFTQPTQYTCPTAVFANN